MAAKDGALDWPIEVIRDLMSYMRDNGMSRTAECLRDAELIYRGEQAGPPQSTALIEEVDKDILRFHPQRKVN